MNTRDPPSAASCTQLPDSVNYSCCTMEGAMLQQAMESQCGQRWPSLATANCIVLLLPMIPVHAHHPLLAFSKFNLLLSCKRPNC
jgi:hypothetical protein